MQNRNRVYLESVLAKSMLEEILGNQTIKSILSEIADKLRSEVLPSAMEQLNQNKAFDDLSPSMRGVIHSWSIKHSKEDAFLGALLPDYTQNELMHSASGHSLLLTAIYEHLSTENIKKASTLHDVITIIKILDDMGYYYVSDAMTKSNLAEYEIIKNMIYPTAEELDMRCPRPETMQAVTYGIGTELHNDLIPKNTNLEGCFSGKAKYFVPPAEKRFARCKPWFEKLATEKESTSGKPLPLIAGLSSSSARLLITLLHLNAFDKNDKSFDLDKAQIISNCLMGYFVFCGHHSFVEVIEIWNRLLDYTAIYHSDKLPKNIFSVIHSANSQTNDFIVEQTLPYARIGDYHSFLHESYANSLVQKMEAYSKDKGSVANLGMFSKQNKTGPAVSINTMNPARPQYGC